MTRDEWVAKVEEPLRSILFQGYTTPERDPAQLFRMMVNDAKRLRAALERAYEELRPAAKK